MMTPPRSRGGKRIRHVVVFRAKPTEGFISGRAVDVNDDDSGLLSGHDTNVRAGPFLRPTQDNRCIDGRSRLPVLDAGMLCRCFAIAVSAAAVRSVHSMQRDHVPSPTCVIQGGVQELIGGHFDSPPFQKSSETQDAPRGEVMRFCWLRGTTERR